MVLASETKRHVNTYRVSKAKLEPRVLIGLKARINEKNKLKKGKLSTDVAFQIAYYCDTL